MNTEPTASELLEQIKAKCAVALLTKGYIPPVLRSGDNVVERLGGKTTNSLWNFVRVEIENRTLIVWGMRKLQPYDLRWNPDDDD
jgi:hypothetical protein